MTAVYRKELKSFFCNMTGVVFITWMLVWLGYYVRMYNLESCLSTFQYVPVSSAFLALLVVPILTMRSFAEERSSRTDRLLYSLPIRTWDVVLGKFFAMATILAIPLAITCFYPLFLLSHGAVQLAPAYAAIGAMFLLGCALIAIGMFISSLTESQVIAAVLSFGVVIGLYLLNGLASSMSQEASSSLIALLVTAIAVAALAYLLTKNGPVSLGIGVLLVAVTAGFYGYDNTKFEGLVPTLLEKIDLYNRMLTFAYGLVDLSALFLYVTVAGLFLFFSVQSLEKKRWS